MVQDPSSENIYAGGPHGLYLIKRGSHAALEKVSTCGTRCSAAYYHAVYYYKMSNGKKKKKRGMRIDACI